ncbi:lipocalin family protein [Rubrivirga sp.]|uniref:lipocalin family protein n=1 Tax=Rubrivirga sp. TaxID=1885344 RepID=UPI003C7680D4
MRALVFALLVSAPVLAQASIEVVPDSLEAAPAVDLVDPLLVGTWTLDRVEDGGRIGEMGADVEAMTCVFDADGTGHVTMTLMQDLETIEREQTFDFETASGRIITDSDDQPVVYQIMEDGRLELRHPGGLVLHMERSAE